MEDTIFKNILGNFKGTDTEKYLLGKYIDFVDKRDLEESEGLFLISMDINSVVNRVKDGFEEVVDEVEYKGKYKNKKEEMDAKVKKEEETKRNMEELEEELEQGNYERFGEFVNVNIDTIMEDVIGLREKISNTILRPEDIFNEDTSFEKILMESKEYQLKNKAINPKALLEMTKTLYKRKKERIQWLRVASLCETLYQYLNNNQTREDYFKSKLKLDLNVLLELSEFWKTDFIFRSPKERVKHREDLLFYI